MSAVSWGEILAGETVENAWQIFKGKLSETVERNVPKHGTSSLLKNPWMTREILRMVRKKRRKWKTVKTSANAEELREYRAIEKETAKKIRNPKRKFEKNLVNGEDKNNRKFARYIKSKTKSKTTVGPLLSADRQIITDEREIAEELNKFFSSVFTREGLQNVPEPEKEVIRVKMQPVCITKQQIHNKIKN